MIFFSFYRAEDGQLFSDGELQIPFRRTIYDCNGTYLFDKECTIRININDASHAARISNIVDQAAPHPLLPTVIQQLLAA